MTGSHRPTITGASFAWIDYLRRIAERREEERRIAEAGNDLPRELEREARFEMWAFVLNLFVEGATGPELVEVIWPGSKVGTASIENLASQMCWVVRERLWQELRR